MVGQPVRNVSMGRVCGGRWIVILMAIALGIVPTWTEAQGPDLTAAAVLKSIDRGVRFLTAQQRADGSWVNDLEAGDTSHVVGVTALTTLALINCGRTSQDPNVRKALAYLRKADSDQVYDVSLVIMALAAAKDPVVSDAPRLGALAAYLERAQTGQGPFAGGWHYSAGSPLADPSNAQFAVLGLHEAAEAGIFIEPRVWERAKSYWEGQQNADGGWDYSPQRESESTGSMTVAGIASLAIIQKHLRDDRGVTPDGVPPCCEPEPPLEALERGKRWFTNNFSVTQNRNSGNWLLYSIYGVERAGRLTGLRFFGEHDWYREGADYLLRQQLRNGDWRGTGSYENKSVVGTGLALLFLSKGLSPVLIGKLKHGARDPVRPLELVVDAGNQHPRDVRNLTEHISGLPRWPTLLTTQEVDLAKALGSTGVDALLQAPILYITGAGALEFPPREKALLKEYLLQGGFILATPTCDNVTFEASLKALLSEILPPGEGELRPLAADHPVYRSEHLLHPDGVPLYGVDIGCRTAVIYSREDLGCLWSYWQRHDPPKRNPQFKAKVIRAMQIGVNIAAYATGREPPKSLDAPKKLAADQPLEAIERGLLQIAQLRHTGQWNAAPRALRNLLLAVNETVGLAATTNVKDLLANDPSLFQFPVLYLHGRTKFSFAEDERRQLRDHLLRGGVLIADACCGSAAFDKSFRELMAQLVPESPLSAVPVTHELFGEQVGHDVRRVKRRTIDTANPAAPLSTTVRDVEPLIEAVELDGRLAVLYSKHDISCALERQATLSCEGYLPEDAVKLATNLVLYAMQQEYRLPVAAP